MRNIEATDVPGIIVILVAAGLIAGFKGVILVAAVMVVNYLYFLSTTPEPVAPPPPAPEPKIFGLEQAIAANGIVGGNADLAGKLVTFVTKVLGYQNVVIDQASRRIDELKTDMQNHADSVQYNLQQISRLQGENENHQQSSETARKEAEFTMGVAKTFGR